MSKSGREIELKLELDPAAQDEIKRSGAINGFTAIPGGDQDPAIDLFRHAGPGPAQGEDLPAVRKSGRSWVQTAKLGTGVMGGLSSPLKPNMPFPGRALDFSVIEDADVRGKLAETIGDASVSECFRNGHEAHHAALTRETDGAHIELAFDTGNILAGAGKPAAGRAGDGTEGRAEPCALRGCQGCCSAMCRSAFPPTARPNAATASPKANRTERPPPSLPKMSCLTAGISRGTCLPRCPALLPDADCENRLAVLASEDPEGPHQLRVGLRRLRSAFRLFRPALNPATIAPLDAMAAPSRPKPAPCAISMC
jgi:triphosphatase